MQIFIKGLDGKTFTLDVEPFDLVEGIMMKIAERNETPYKYIRLIYKGKQLHPDNTLKEYEIGPEAMIHLVGRLLGGPEGYLFIPIHVKDLTTGKSVRINVTPSKNISELIQQLNNIEAIFMTNKCLAFNKNVLDIDKTLDYYGICSDSTIFVMPVVPKRCSCSHCV